MLVGLHTLVNFIMMLHYKWMIIETEFMGQKKSAVKNIKRLYNEILVSLEENI